MYSAKASAFPARSTACTAGETYPEPVIPGRPAVDRRAHGAAHAAAAVLAIVLVGGIAAGPAAPAATDPPPPGIAEPIGGPRMAEPGLVVDPSASPLPPMTAASWLVADATSGAVLAAADPHGQRRPASTLKTLLALTMAPRLDVGGSYTAQEDDEAVEGTRVGMLATQTYSIRDLWYALFLRSGNDAANGLAKAGAGGDLATAVRLMQAEAQRLQALDTTVVNPSGLDADGQYASAYDLALWGRAALTRGDLREYSATLRRKFPGNHTRTATPATARSFWMYTQNRLIGKYEGAIGVKNGFTSLARNTLIAAAERDGRTILVTLMGVPGLVHDQAAKLLDWGFAVPADAPAVGMLADPRSASLAGADDEPGGVGEHSGQAGQAVEDHPAVAGQSAATLRVAVGTAAGMALLLTGAMASRRRRRRRP